MKIICSDCRKILNIPNERLQAFKTDIAIPCPTCNGKIEITGCDRESNLDRIGWYCGNSGYKTHRVSQKEPNSWGLYDMHGNVWEWVEDDWHFDYSGAPDDGRAWLDEPRGTIRVMRGGSWSNDALVCRSADRCSSGPGIRDHYYGCLGFRLARSVALGP